MQDGSNQLRICHVVVSMKVGGLERVVIDLLRRGPHLGQRGSVVILEERGHLAHEADRLDDGVVFLGKRPGLRPALVLKLRSIFRELRPDVVHTHQVGALTYAGPAAKMAGIGVLVHTEHGKHYAGSRRMRLLGRLGARFTDRFFCVSSDVADEVRSCGVASPEKVYTVPNGIDVLRYASKVDPVLQKSFGLNPGAPIIGTIGRLSEVKRQDVLLRAFASVRKSVTNARLLIVGDGEERARLERLAAELNISDATHFAGYRTDPENCLPLMNVFVLTSRSEGMPLSVLESWAARVPVVTSAVGGLPELLGNGRLGWLFPAGDHEACAAAICGVLGQQASQVQEKAARAFETVNASYSLDRVAGEYHRHYLELVGAVTPIEQGLAAPVCS